MARFDFISIRSPADQTLIDRLKLELDPGESEAIALALEVGAEAILIDEYAGREVARRMGLQRIGVLGLLGRAKKDNIIPAVRPLLDQLRIELAFRVSQDLFTEFLKSIGE